MLVIREAQLEVFRKQPRLTFEREMAAYLRRYFPFEAAHADLQAWVSGGLDRAAQYGFLSYAESAQYLALMAILGAGFDEDPQIPWAGETILSAHGTSSERISRVFDQAVEHLEAIGGPKCSWLVRAKLRVRKQDMSVLNRGVHSKALAARIRELLVRMYPQKAAVIGERAMQQVVKSAMERSEALGRRSAQSALIHAVHMYYLGSDFDRDPCYPWAGAALSDNSAGSVDEGYVRMHQLSLEYLDKSFHSKA